MTHVLRYLVRNSKTDGLPESQMLEGHMFRILRSRVMTAGAMKNAESSSNWRPYMSWKNLINFGSTVCERRARHCSLYVGGSLGSDAVAHYSSQPHLQRAFLNVPPSSKPNHRMFVDVKRQVRCQQLASRYHLRHLKRREPVLSVTHVHHPSSPIRQRPQSLKMRPIIRHLKLNP